MCVMTIVLVYTHCDDVSDSHLKPSTHRCHYDVTNAQYSLQHLPRTGVSQLCTQFTKAYTAEMFYNQVVLILLYTHLLKLYSNLFLFHSPGLDVTGRWDPTHDDCWIEWQCQVRKWRTRPCHSHPTLGRPCQGLTRGGHRGDLADEKSHLLLKEKWYAQISIVSLVGVQC